MSRTVRASRVLASGISLLALSNLSAQAGGDSIAKHSTRAPISIGNYPNVTGLRLNFRDRALEQVTGVNLTVWSPYKRASGDVKGLSLGLLAAGSRDMHGIGLAPIGINVDHEFRGIALGGLGVGTGTTMKGIALGGIGVGGAGPMSGIIAGGIGAGTAGSVRGILVGGLAAASGGAMNGVVMGGLGAGVARDLTGIAMGGLGVGVAGNVKGIMLGGLGAGVGGNITGIVLSGIGTAAGGTFKGIGVSGIAIASANLHGAFMAPAIGTTSGRGIFFAPILFRVKPDGDFTGISLSSVNAVRGAQRGLSVGLVNYARTLNGVQVGIINIVKNAKSHKVLPIFNWGSDKSK